MASQKPRSVMPNKEKIRALRKRRMWTQETLAEKVACNKRNIQRAEAKGRRVSLTTLDEIAQALEVEVHELMVPDIVGGDDPEEWLKRAIRYDLAANYGLAIEIGKVILESVPSSEDLFRKACVRLATFYEHSHDWEAALQLLDEHLLADEKLLEPVEGQTAWAMYQRGLIRRCLAEDYLRRSSGEKTPRIEQLLGDARADLERVLASPQATSSAPLHQLGVLLMIEQDYSTALEKLQRSLRLRQAHDGDNPLDHAALYRHGYTYRRMGQCYARMERLEEAEECLGLAQKIAKTTGHQRLLSEVKRDLDAWGLKRTSEFGARATPEQT